MDEYNAADSLWRALTSSKTQGLVEGMRREPDNLRIYPSVPAADEPRTLPVDDQLTAHLYRSFDSMFGTRAYDEMLAARDRADEESGEIDQGATRGCRRRAEDDEADPSLDDIYESDDDYASAVGIPTRGEI
jgi:hypothetical protein